MTAEQLISFARGVPSLDIIDVAGLKAAAIRALDEDPGAATGYGPATGHPALRTWVAHRLAVPVDQVLLTNGSLQADAFVFDHFVRPGDDVIVERPTYDRTLLNLRNLGAKIHTVGLDGDGLLTAELRRLLESGVRPRLAHVIPNFQNPAGVTLGLARRRELLDLAAEYEFTIFEDDPYAEIRFRGDALPSLHSLAGPVSSVVVRASSFTKTICPGVRVGYLVGDPALITDLARRALTTYISPNMLAEATVYEFCRAGDLDRSIARVRTVLARRAAMLAEALRREIPTATLREPDGGYFLWVRLPESVSVERLFAAANARGVTFVKGTDFMLDGGHSELRLAYSGVADEQIGEGVSRIAAALDDIA